ncbi:hypothetical protein DYH09_08425 [bacterium CPR1]|nr:hypothetical protein [bacterium CPR1]
MQRRLSALYLILMLLTACGPVPQGGPAGTVSKWAEGKPRPLEVTFASPVGEVESPDDAAAILVGFNQPMTALQPLPTERSIGPLTLTPAVNGKFRWKGTATLVFTPDKPLSLATRFKATVPAGTPSAQGPKLEKDYVFEFETPRPRMVKSEPSDEAKWVPLDQVFLLEFNQPMTPGKLVGLISLQTTDKETKTIDLDVREPDARELARFFGPEPDEATRERFNRLVAAVAKKPLETGQTYRLVLRKGLLATSGELGSGDEQSFTFSTVNRFELTSLREAGKKVSPNESLTFNFSNPVNYAELARNLTFEPAVKIPESYLEDRDYASEDLYFYLRKTPRTSYKVRLGEGLKDQFGNTLGKAVELTFKTGDYPAGVRMPEGTAVLETATPDPRIPIGLMNVKQAELKAAVLQADQLIRAVGGLHKYKPPGGFKLIRKLTPNDKPNVVQDRYFKVADALGKDGSGWLFITLKHGDENRNLLVQVTNLGLTAKFSPENTVVWATALDTGKPLPGTALEIRDEKGNLLGSATTGADGTASFKGWHTFGLKQEDRWSQPPLYIYGRSGSQVAFICSRWNWQIDPWSFDLAYDYSPEVPERRGMAFSERGLYRAGEEVYMKGALREVVSGSYQIPELKQLDFKLMDSRDQLVKLGVVDLGSFGSFDHTLKLAKNAPTGYYSIFYYLPGEARKSLKNEGASPLFVDSFRVEAFRPAQFEVKVDVKEPVYAFGDKLQSELLGRYLFGGLMKGDAVEWTVRAVPHSYQPEGWDGWDFGPLSWLDSDDEQPEEARTLLKGSGKLDDQGQKKLEAELALKYKGSAAVTVEGTVTSASRQQISGRATVLAHPGNWLIGLRPKSSFLSSRAPAGIDVVTVTSEGKNLGGQKVNLELFRREWHSVRRAETGGSYRWVVTSEDQKVGEPIVVTTKDSAVLANLNPDKSGFYVVKAWGEDSKGRKIETQTTFYASGSDYVGWARSENDQVGLVADKKSYKPGETARILVKSPYEDCQALVTVERELIMRRFVVELKGSTPTIEVPLKSEDLPNAFISVVLVEGRLTDKGFDEQGEDLGKPSFRIGYVNLPVDTGEKHLSVSVKTDREEYQPRQTVTINLEVKDARGRPVQAEVDVAVVDRGVLNLINYQTPDFFAPFYGPRSLRVVTAEMRRDVIGLRSYGTKGDPEGGGGAGVPGETREDFRATPYWNPRVLTDSQGKATVTFELPDSLTSFRVMATALTRASDFGASDCELRVNKPVQMLPSIPRFVRIEDRFQAGVLVHNNTRTSGSVEVSVQAEGVDLSGEGKATVSVPAGEEKEVMFDFLAKRPAEAKLTFQARMDIHQDGLALPLPVLLPVATETVADSGDTEGQVKIPLGLASRPAPGVGGLTITLSPSILSGLSGALEYVSTYPYGCLEQRLTRLAPNFLFPDLLEAYAEGDRKKARKLVQASLDELGGFQAPGGGMLLWPSSKWVNAYLSVYALDMLNRAKDDGYEVDKRLLTDLRGYVKKVPNAETFDYPYSQAEEIVVRSYAVSVLARLGVKDRGAFDRLYADRTLRNELTSRVRMEADSAYFQEKDQASLGWVYGSNVRLTAQILAVLLEEEAPPDFAPRLVKYLMSVQKNGHWGNTQEDLAVLTALDRYRDKFEKGSPNFKAFARIDARSVLERSFSGTTAQVANVKIPMAELPVGKVNVDLEKQGKGRLYYTLRLQYAPAEDVPARDEGFMVLKQVVNVETNTVDPVLKAGKIYKVTLSVITPQERRFVVLDDPLPGGLEVVQTTFETESDTMRRALQMGSKDRSGWGGTFDHFEVHDDRVLLFAQQLEPGEHTFEYLVRAGYPGKYDQPATKCEEMYEPEVFGTTARQAVEIR